MANKSFEQQIAVFGESGSGKTVLLSSLYGSLVDAAREKQEIFSFQAADQDLGIVLRQNYLQMVRENKVPLPTAFKSTQHVFAITPTDKSLGGKRPTRTLELTWHDYPGEWFGKDSLGESEEKERIKTFKSLLGADVALFLIDAARLKEFPGEEEYLNAVFNHFRNSLSNMKDRILDDGKKLEQFPRLWIIALTKADLLPEMTVGDFQDLVIQKSAAELNELREVLSSFIVSDDALSIDDYVLLSSAKFASGKIDPRNQKGIDILLPLATLLPVERFLKWNKLKLLPMRLLSKKFAQLVMPFMQQKLPKLVKKLPLHKNQKIINGAVALIPTIAEMALDDLLELKSEALEEHEFYVALMADFMTKLKVAESEHVFAEGQL
ncbi:TRAFAC clade GTPase domain-containing protein [Corynebacterium vitaeruminis]|uniref:TRAFAC clade GTPase domain-containing protein n=1 Tax=Corynebacterium vitaeruminis TaxID=38305 RepID=UPI00046CDC11|nr:GTPase [Corynebacterium vitaeruminis]